MGSTAVLYFQVLLKGDADQGRPNEMVLVLASDTMLTSLKKDAETEEIGPDASDSPTKKRAKTIISCFPWSRRGSDNAGSSRSRHDGDECNTVELYRIKLTYYKMGHYEDWSKDDRLADLFATSETGSGKYKISRFSRDNIFVYIAILGPTTFKSELERRLNEEVEQLGIDGCDYVNGLIRDFIAREHASIVELFEGNPVEAEEIRTLLNAHPSGSAVVLFLNKDTSIHRVYEITHDNIMERTQERFFSCGFGNTISNTALKVLAIENPPIYTQHQIEDIIQAILDDLANLPANKSQGKNILVNSQYQGYIISPQHTFPPQSTAALAALYIEGENRPDIPISSAQAHILAEPQISDTLRGIIAQSLQ